MKNSLWTTFLLLVCGGLGLGPLLAGMLVQYAPQPLDLVFAVHIAMAVLGGVAVLVVP